MSIKQGKKIENKDNAASILISIRSENSNKVLLNDIKLKCNIGTNPIDIANEFIEHNKIKGATIYINELRTCYKMGSLVFEDRNLANQTASIYGTTYQKVVTVHTISKINV